MSQLIEDLKRDHVSLLASLTEVNRLGIVSKDGQDKLALVKNLLLSHLGREDRDLYPVLRAAAASDAKVKATLDSFAKDMDTISKAIMDFFDKYSGGGSGMDFVMDYGRISGALQSRIKREENMLYKEFLRVA